MEVYMMERRGQDVRKHPAYVLNEGPGVISTVAVHLCIATVVIIIARRGLDARNRRRNECNGSPC